MQIRVAHAAFLPQNAVIAGIDTRQATAQWLLPATASMTGWKFAELHAQFRKFLQTWLKAASFSAQLSQVCKATRP
jgi:hypothetical protein